MHFPSTARLQQHAGIHIRKGGRAGLGHIPSLQLAPLHLLTRTGRGGERQKEAVLRCVKSREQPTGTKHAGGLQPTEIKHA